MAIPDGVLLSPSPTLADELDGLKPHDHLCLIHESPGEWTDAAVPFLLTGLARGEKCFYLVDTTSEQEIRHYLAKAGADVAACEASGQLVIASAPGAYAPGGAFDPDRMIDWVIEEVEKTISLGFHAARIAGEMTWALRGYSGAERLLEYEARINREIFPKLPCLAICQYDRWKFSPEIIKSIILSHSKLVRGNHVYRNLYYIPPDEFLKRSHAETEVQCWLDNLEAERERQEQTCRYLIARTQQTEQARAELEKEIGERRQIEQALRDSEEQYRLLFESNPHPMWVFDLETHRFLAVNEAAVSHYGYSREEFLGMTIRDIRPPEEVSRLLLYQYKPGTRVQWAGLWKHHKKDGTIIDVEVTTGELTFNGRPARLALVNDVSERRRLEEELRQSHKMEAIGQLAGGVAHDFNNLLTLISGYGDLAREALDEHPASQHIEEIQKAAERAASLTRQLLAFSRRQVLQPKLLDLNALVTEVESMLRRLIGEDIELVTVHGPGLALVLADPVQMQQVLLNLAVNARDAMPRGGRLVIRTANVDVDRSGPRKGLSPGRYVLLSIADTGIGMDEQTQRRIFEPFFTTKRLGTGLGLSTVYGIVKQSGGHIDVVSALGKGSTFEIYLPQTEQSNLLLEPADVSALAAQGTETVLLVEDDDSVRRLVRDVLQRRGFTVLEAAGPADAITACERHEEAIDLLLADVVMPQMSGLEVADRLRRQRPGLRVLFISGHAAAMIGRHGVVDERAPLLEKPFTTEGLIRKVREVLDAA